MQAFVEAVPTGKQNSMAAHNPPDLVFAVVREHGLWSLANAFVRPVWPTGKDSLVQRSVEELDRYWGKLVTMFGADAVTARAVCTTEEDALDALRGDRVATVKTLTEKVLAAIPATGGKEGA
jgi:CRISPR system Cascade subunit CasC